jgi:hypothetical protein
MIHNALTAAGVWDEWPADQFFLFAAFDFPVPKNEFVNLMRRTNDLPLDDPDRLYADAAVRQTLLQDGRLPTVPGALAEAIPARRENDVYDTDLDLIFYDEPFLFDTYRTRFRKILSEPRYSDIGANLRHFSELYKRIRASRPPVDRFLEAHPTLPPSERERFAAFYARLQDSIDRESAAVDARLARMPSRSGAPVARNGPLAAHKIE